MLDRPEVEALAVKRRTATGIQRVYGVLTAEMAESAYRRQSGRK